MTEVHALALRHEAALPSPGEWRTLVEMAGMLVPTKFLPDTIRTPEQAVAIILKGREVRVPPMYALSNIVVVQGKPTCSAELLLALIYRDHGDDALIVEESTPVACRVTYKRRAWADRRPFAFTIADAETAKLAGKETWKSYPQAMLRARCVSAVARLAFPDSIAGMYTPEELGADVRVTDDGAVEMVAAPAPAPSGPSPRMRALIAEMDQAVADDATTDIVDPEQIEGWKAADTAAPAPARWATTPLGRQVTALLAALAQANKTVSPPADDADEATLRGWIASKRTVLGPTVPRP